MIDEKNVLQRNKDRIVNNDVLNYEKVVRKYKEGGYHIVTEQARYSAEKLVEEFSTKMDPEYQRRKVWDEKKKSKLIESLIINIPIPPIFLYEYDLYEYEVMDGLQRISTITNFFSNEFKLKGLQIWNELNGLYYKDLDKSIQQSIKRRYISAIILLKETARNELEENALKQLVFERLNTGGVELLPQEVRNALYQCEFNRRIIKMSENEIFKQLWGFNIKNTTRMEDVELVLRFFSYISAVHLSLSGSTKSILDMYAEKAMQFSIYDCDRLEDVFNDTILTVRELFGITAFKSTPNGKSEKMMFDTIMLFTYNNLQHIDSLHKKAKNLEIEKFRIIQENKNSIFDGKYTSIKNVKERVNFFEKELQEN